MIGRDQGVEVNHLPGRLVTPRHLHPRGPPTDRALRGRLLRKLLEQIRSRHRRLSTSNAIAGNQISVETATGKNSHPLSVLAWRNAIAARGTKRDFFQHLRTVTASIIFADWQVLLLAIT